MADLRSLADHEKAAHALRFFKCGKGEYGEGDKFLGVRVPQIRKLAKSYSKISLPDVVKLLRCEYHEARLLALILFVNQYKKAHAAGQEEIYKLYLANTRYINNWDLVDSSASHIVGAYLFERSRLPLYKLVESRSLWERRIAIMATFHFIKRNEFAETVVIAERLLVDEHALIHKAVGWMLREIGKRDRKVEESFLRLHYKTMPRTMLRYAIERFPEVRRQAYLKGMI